MEDYLKHFPEEIISKSMKRLPFGIKDISKIPFTVDYSAEELDPALIGYMPTLDYTKWTESCFWLDIIEYDMKSIHISLIYLNSHLLSGSPDIKNLKDDYYMFLDLVHFKFITVLDRIAQLTNSLYSLGLVEDSFRGGVSFYNVLGLLTEETHSDIKAIFDQINTDNKIQDLKKIRNGLSHHFHVLYQTDGFYTHVIEGDKVTISKEQLEKRKSFDINYRAFFNPILVVMILNNLYRKMENWIQQIAKIVIEKYNINLFEFILSNKKIIKT